MVVDSDVLIDFFRDFEKARDFFLGIGEKLIVSRVTVMEVILGVKTRRDGSKAMKQMENLGIEVVEINNSISETAGDIFWNYYHKWGMGVIDSLVAATAVGLSEKLVTRNEKHFRQVVGLELIVPY